MVSRFEINQFCFEQLWCEPERAASELREVQCPIVQVEVGCQLLDVVARLHQIKAAVTQQRGRNRRQPRVSIGEGEKRRFSDLE